MNIKKLFDKVSGKESLNAYQQAAKEAERYQQPPKPRTEPEPKRELTSDVTFKNTQCNVPHQITTSEWDREIHSWEEAEDAVLAMQAEEVEFVVLTTGDARHGIRFIQSVPLPDRPGFTVELALEEGDHTRLVEKEFRTGEECLAVFREFYETSFVHDMEEYQPVRFYK